MNCGLAGKESMCNAGDLDSIPGLARSLGEGKGYPLQYSGLENWMDYIVHGVAESDMTEQLSLKWYIIYDNTFYLTQYSQNIISICNQYESYWDILHSFSLH